MENSSNSTDLTAPTSTTSSNSIDIAEEGIMNLYLQSLKASIQNELLCYFKDKPNYSFTFKENKLSSNLLIQVKLKKSSSINTFHSDIYFSIKLDSQFPESSPIVTCNSNFIFPSLFDNRNLLLSLTTYQWQSNSKLTNLLESIPRFLNKYSFDLRNRVMTFYGEFKLNQPYEINDFLLNSENQLYKVEVEINESLSSNKEICIKRETRYLIITDSHLLMFTPCQLKCCDKSKAKLTLISELRGIKSFRYAKMFSSEKPKGRVETNLVGIIIEWNRPQSLYENVIVMEHAQNKQFIEVIEYRRKLITDNFLMFQDDLNRLNVQNYFTKVSEDSTQKLIQLIENREKFSMKNLDEETLKDLMLLYQRIIEIYSAQNNEEYIVYMQKLHKLLESNDKITNKDNSFSLLA